MMGLIARSSFALQEVPRGNALLFSDFSLGSHNQTKTSSYALFVQRQKAHFFKGREHIKRQFMET